MCEDGIPLAEHLQIVDEIREAHRQELAITIQGQLTERDRRYTEAAESREKARDIKDLGDQRALELSREGQRYRDEQANKLREQINSERGLYATKDDLNAVTNKFELLLKPINDYVATQQGRYYGTEQARTDQRLNLGQMLAIVGTMIAIIGVAATIIIATR